MNYVSNLTLFYFTPTIHIAQTTYYFFTKTTLSPSCGISQRGFIQIFRNLAQPILAGMAQENLQKITQIGTDGD